MFNFITKYIKKTKKNSNKSKKKSNTNKSNKSTKSTNASIGGKTKNDLCAHKYKDKAIRGTPKNWAYNRCMKNGWERCKNLPPAGYNMYKEFCE